MNWNELHEQWDIFSKLPVREVNNDTDEGYNTTYNRHLQAISTAIIHYSLNVAEERLKRGWEWYHSNNRDHEMDLELIRKYPLPPDTGLTEDDLFKMVMTYYLVHPV